MREHIGEVEQLILFAILRLGEEAYGAAIRTMIREKTGRSVSAGGIYTILSRMEERRLVESCMGEPTPERGGRRKKLYTPTRIGARALEQSFDAVHALADGMVPTLRALARGDR